ncbi:15288_t:CDS:2, partial [Acaulospora colombiana]
MAQNGDAESGVPDEWMYIMLIGDPAVGKASITRRYIDGAPPPPSDDMESFRVCNGAFFLPLDSSPIHPNGQRRRQPCKRVRVNWGDRMPEMVLMKFFFNEVPGSYTFPRDHEYWSEQFSSPTEKLIESPVAPISTALFFGEAMDAARQIGAIDALTARRADGYLLVRG